MMHTVWGINLAKEHYLHSFESYGSTLQESEMDLKEYFRTTKGIGVMATADKDGKVNAAIYARPHFIEDGTIAFIMRDRLTHHNIQSNPQTTYLFVEDGPGYKGKRLYLTKIREEQDGELIESLRRRSYKNDKDKVRFLLIFRLDDTLPLVGPGEE